VVEVLQEENFLFARRGVFPEYRDGGTAGCGLARDPDVDHPLAIPTAAYAGPDWNMRDPKVAVESQVWYSTASPGPSTHGVHLSEGCRGLPAIAS